jgi:putative redox protein
MTIIQGKYEDRLRVRSVHLDSGAEICTVAPKDNNGDGSLFSPTDLLGTALGSCMLTICGIKAASTGDRIDVASYRAEKIMASNPRRVAGLNLEIVLPAQLPLERRAMYEEAMQKCPVLNSLHPNTQVILNFKYE